MAPLSEGADVGIRAAGVEGAGRVRALGTGIDVGVGDVGAGEYETAWSAMHFYIYGQI